jgi:hypothetical protein
MIDCKHLSKETCLKNTHCKYTNGAKRQFCRKAKNTMKKKRKSQSTKKAIQKQYPLKPIKVDQRKVAYLIHFRQQNIKVGIY